MLVRSRIVEFVELRRRTYIQHESEMIDVHVLEVITWTKQRGVTFDHIS